MTGHVGNLLLQKNPKNLSGHCFGSSFVLPLIVLAVL